MPKTKAKYLPVEQVAEDLEEEMPLHGVINKDEARLYIDALDAILNMAWEIEEGIPRAMENNITTLKQAMVKILPGTEEYITAITKSRGRQRRQRRS